ncbi:hypothetical protein PG984_010409 [Apiospora sp. TS-2023a]
MAKSRQGTPAGHPHKKGEGPIIIPCRRTGHRCGRIGRAPDAAADDAAADDAAADAVADDAAADDAADDANANVDNADNANSAQAERVAEKVAEGLNCQQDEDGGVFMCSDESGP